jgi:hypothetical protein
MGLVFAFKNEYPQWVGTTLVAREARLVVAA